jgi:hypothetical protein
MPKTTEQVNMVETMTPQQRTFFEQMFSYLNPELLQQLFGGTFGLQSDAMKNIAQQAGPIDEETLRRRFQTRTADPTMQQFREEVVPMLQERFGAMGSGGGPSEQAALAQSGERLSADLSRQYEDVYDAAQNRQLAAGQAISQMSTQQMAALMPYIQQLISAQTQQPVITQTTKTSPFESFINAAAQGVGTAFGGGAVSGASSAGKAAYNWLKK